ncbi:YheC/YheD family protein [Brevibacillus laterosporus]|uniref:YheC/YheD family protein n=1 Tax=Brevibacillus laterosporus TaxID=1465 RepID=UPI003D20572A
MEKGNLKIRTVKKHIWDTKRVVWYRDSFWVQIDLGIEKSGRIWTIEVNSKPGHMLFARLPDKSSLRKIKENKCLSFTIHSIRIYIEYKWRRAMA